MKVKTIAITGIILSATLHQANALVPAFGGEFGVGLDTSFGYNSNINANNAEQGDNILTVTPSVMFKRQKGLITLDAGAGVNVIRYDNTGDSSTLIGSKTPNAGSGNNSNDPFFYISLAGSPSTDNPLTFNSRFDFRRLTAANSLVGALTESYNYNVSANTRYQINEKYGVGVAPFFSYQDYQTAGFNDPLSTGVSLSGYYTYSEKLSFDAGYRLRYEQVNGTPKFESYDHTFFVGALGVLLPKVTGNIQVGITYRDWVEPATESDFPFPYFSAGLDWAYNEKTSFGLFGLIDLSQSPGNQGLEIYSIGLSADHTINQKWSIGGSVSYQHNKFTGNGPTRDDNSIQFGANVNYDINSWAYAGLSASYTLQDSNQALFDFGQYTVFANVGVRF